MQDNPEKTAGNYNEFRGGSAPINLRKGFIDIKTEANPAVNERGIVTNAIDLVNNKVNEILGPNNKLTRKDLAYPKIEFLPTDPKYPDFAGYFLANTNEIKIVKDNISKDSHSITQVVIHEYIHYLSHNGRDFSEKVDNNSPVARSNNVGLSRDFGLDVRKGKEGEYTSDYFLSFNEAVTEQLTIDILPGQDEVYRDYRGLLNQVMDDAVTRGLGSNNKNGEFTKWSREEFKNYIYSSFFRGDLGGFTNLLQTVYEKYDISERQFGLMTNKSDLPSVIEQELKAQSRPYDPPPSPGQVAILVQQRLDSKKPSDYVTDVVGPGPDGGGNDSENVYGTQYDTFIQEGKIKLASKVNIQGKVYEVDSQGMYIYHGEYAQQVFNYIREELDSLLDGSRGKNITETQITEHIDQLLFDKYHTSMLSEGFRDFYIYKHIKLADSH